MIEKSGDKAEFSGWKTRLDPLLGASAKLCPPCQSFFDNRDLWLNPGKLFPHHQHPVELRSAAWNHCPLCYQFLKGGPRAYQADHNITDVSMIGTHELLGIHVQHIQYQDPETSIADEYFRLNLKFTIPNLGNPSTKVALVPPILSETDTNLISAYCKQYPLAFGEYCVALYPTRRNSSESPIDDPEVRSTKSSLKSAKKWLHDCSSHHDACKFSSQKHRPTRLVSTAIGQCRVELQDEFKTAVEYATLSHCWGTTKYLMLSKSNMNQLQIQIPEDALSRTVRDAITIARDLGFAYIWVDTLCIIQDDPEDWSREAAAMSSVYGSSGVNIAAAGARDGRGGCFFPRPVHWNLQLELSDNHSSLSYSAAPLYLYSKCLSDMPLMERGWVLQERLLAVRTLHFTNTELFWECNHTTVCESFPEKLPGFVTASSKILYKKPLVDSMWPWIVTTYSHCKLTRAQDKLVAVSGLARKIQQKTQDHYVAGLWRRDMEAQLCWYTWFTEKRRKKGTYIAPSWSWAAVDSPITGCFRDLSRSSVLISVLDVEIGHTGPDPLGVIDTATVRIRCYGLHRMRFDISIRKLLYSNNGDEVGGLVYRDNVPDDDEEQIQDVLMLPVFESFGKKNMITGLVLQHASSENGVYRRIGKFDVPVEGNLVDSLGDIVDDRDGNFSKCYTEVLRDKSGAALSYVIDVI